MMKEKQIKVQDIIELLEEPIDLIKTITTDPLEIEHILNYALYEYLYPPKRSARDRIIKPSVTSKVVDSKEPSDNIVKVDFSCD